jgi:truncated hemoglobin YjbI
MARNLSATGAAASEGRFDPYQALGGMEGCRGLSVAFYSRVEQDPRLRPIFPSSFHCAIEAFAAFLAQTLGGPCNYSPRRWWLSLREAHLRFKIGPGQRDAWLRCMRKALKDVHVEEPMRTALDRYFEQSSAFLVNQGKPPSPATAPGGSTEEPVLEDLLRRWNVQRTLELVVAAVRQGDADRALALADSPIVQTTFERDCAALVNLLALMIEHGDTKLLEYVRHTLQGDPSLARVPYTYGRTLLHAASVSANLAFVALLLDLGADPNASPGGHSPLYCVANECSGQNGPRVVPLLVQAGASVSAPEGVERCTPLHMAARRGNVPVAEALLDCGADLQSRDRKGATPLRRALNCRQAQMAAFLRSRGAVL